MLIVSAILLLLPLYGMLVNLRKRRDDIEAAWVFRTIALVSGFFFAGVEAGMWPPLVFVQAAVVLSATWWSFRVRRRPGA